MSYSAEGGVLIVSLSHRPIFDKSSDETIVRTSFANHCTGEIETIDATDAHTWNIWSAPHVLLFFSLGKRTYRHVLTPQFSDKKVPSISPPIFSSQVPPPY